MALACRSYDCVHNNKEGKCFAQMIDISGRTAKMISGTTCSSFIQGSPYYEIADEFMADVKYSSNTANIRCYAKHCRYNAHTVCKADHVLINDEDASCGTFEIKE